MIHTNPDSPINWPIVITPGQLRRLNKTHRDMMVLIDQAYDSTAMQSVAISQYATAVSELRRAFGKVRDMQLSKMDMAHDNLPDLHTLGL